MKFFRLMMFILAGLLLISCEEDFNPYGDYVERYAFTCILKNTGNYQAATLFRSYRPEAFDPNTYTEDPFVAGADIRVWYNDSVFVFSDTSVTRTDTSRYKTPFSFYYNDKFSIGSRKTIELEVLLPNGKRLRSSSVTPAQIIYDDNSDVIIPPGIKSVVQITWNTLDEGTYFSPAMTIRYRQNINGESVEKTKDVPVKYVSQGNGLVAVYPAPSAATNIVFELDAVRRALEEISQGDAQKQNYSVYQNIIFKVAAFDMPASRYLSSTGGTIDDLTVSVDVADYTNIEGGFGLFGSYIVRDYERLRFLENYIESFGYNFIVEND